MADRIPGQKLLAKPPLTVPHTDDDAKDDKGDDDQLRVLIDIDLRFRDLKAAVPIFADELSYVNMALIRPIVYFMKYVLSSLLPFGNTDFRSANRTLVPIRCRVVKNLSDFDGSWTVSDSSIFRILDTAY